MFTKILLLYLIAPLIENILIGNLAVKADPTFGGGVVHISGSAVVEGEYLLHHLIMNSTEFDVLSGGGVSIESGNSSSFNGVGGEVSISSGSGNSLQGEIIQTREPQAYKE